MPIKLNSAGVIPVIFASSLLAIPATIAQFVKNDGLTNFVDDSTIKEMCNTYDSYSLADKLVDEANRNGGGDNVTVVTVTDR